MGESEIKLEDFFTKVLSIIGKTTEAEVAELLKKAGKTIAVAESLTGGLISSKLTSQPGSSEHFTGGIVCYHNRIKVMELGVPAGVIAKESPVSKDVAVAMAEGIRKRYRTDIGLSATGIAGPTSLTPPKPIGLTYIALTSDQGTIFKELHLAGGRGEIREKAAAAALGLLWLHLGGEEVLHKI
ncbi:MAG: CinA family protein [bacterium]